MILYRFAHKKYANDISGAGAKIYGGRWNHKGLAGLYTSGTISLALLEILANALSLDQLQSLCLVKLHIPTALEVSLRELNNLKEDWDQDMEYSRFIGSEFLQNRSFLILRCPSAVINEEPNYLVNPLHVDYKEVEIESITEYKFDKRLFKVQSYSNT